MKITGSNLDQLKALLSTYSDEYESISGVRISWLVPPKVDFFFSSDGLKLKYSSDNVPKTKPNSFIELVNDQLEKHKIDFQILNRIFNDHHDRDSTLTFYSNPSAFAQECESDRWNDNIQCGHSTVCDCVNQILAQVKRELTFTVTVNLAVTHKLNLFRTLLLHRMTTIDGFQAFHLIFETKSSEPQHKSAVDAMVVARESDWIGAVDVILSYPRHCALFVFVQESVHKSFYQRLIQQIKLQHLLFVVDDEICVTSNRDRVSKMNVPHTHVILFKYRNIQEAIGLVRQAQPINRTLLWLNSIALGQDVATKIDRCSAFWLDSVPFETRTGSKYFGRACCIDRTNRGRANPLSLQERAAQLTQIGRLTLKHNESKAMIEQVAACKRLLHQVQEQNGHLCVMKYKEQATKMAVETDVLDYDQCWKVIAVLYLSGNSICVSSGSPLAECISECQLNEYLPDYFSILQSLGNAKTVSISKNNFVDDLSQLIQYTHVWFPNTNQLKYYA